MELSLELIYVIFILILRCLVEVINRLHNFIGFFYGDPKKQNVDHLYAMYIHKGSNEAKK